MLNTSTLKKYFGLIHIIAAVALCLTVNACQKDKNEFIPTGSHIDTLSLSFAKPTDTMFVEESKLDPINPSNLLSVEKLHGILAANIKTPFSDSFTAEKGKKITFPDSTTVEIPANICTKSPDGNGSAACKGNLKIEVLVLRTKGELVAYNLPTFSEGNLLQSGGIVKLRITQNGLDVFVQNGQFIKVTYKMPSIISNMRYYDGGFDMNTRLNFDWHLVDDNNNRYPRLSAVDSTTYQLLIDRFNFVNCDKLYGTNVSLSKNLIVALPDSFSNQNTSVFIVFSDILSVVRLVGDPRVKSFVIPQNYKGLPTGKSGKLVTMSLLSSKGAPDRFYFSVTPISIGDIIVKPIPSSITPDGIKQKLLAL